MTVLACLAYYKFNFKEILNNAKQYKKTTLIMLKGKERENMDKFSKDAFS